MEEVLDIFRVIESGARGRGFGSLLLVSRLAGINAFAKEIFQISIIALIKDWTQKLTLEDA